MKTPSSIPAIALSNALIFADPGVKELIGLGAVSGTWRDAIVLAKPFWDERKGKLNKPIDVTGDISPLLAASITFDPDRQVTINMVSPDTISDELKASLALVRRVRLLPTIEMGMLPKLIEWMPSLTALTVFDTEQLKGCVAAVASLDSLVELRVNHFMDEVTLAMLEPLAESLRKLHLGACNEVADISSLAKFVKLEELRMSGCAVLEETSVLDTVTSLRTKNINRPADGDMDPWEFDVYTTPVAVPVALLGTFSRFLRSDDADENMQGTLMIRKMLSVDDDRPNDEVVEEGCVELFVAQLLRDEFPQLQFESAWALTNLASGGSNYTHLILSTEKSVQNFVRLLGSPNEDCREQAAWAIGNLAGDGARCRDWCLECGALEPLMAVATADDEKLATVRNGVWALSQLCRGKPLVEHGEIAPVLPVIVTMLHHDDDDIITDAAWAMSFLSDGPDDRIQTILDTGCLPRMVELLTVGNSAMATPTLRMIGNVVTGTDRQTQAVIDAGALVAFQPLLTYAKRSIRKEVCFALSNITAGTEGQIQAVIDANLFPGIMIATKATEADVKKEAVWAIANATSGGSAIQIDHLVQNGVLQCLCDLLGTNHPKVMLTALETVDNILDCGEQNRHAEELDRNPYAEVLVKLGGVALLEDIPTDNSAMIDGRDHFLQKHFPS